MKLTHKSDLKPNRLILEKSPYLLQHAYNPVDWYPWDQEAFEKAEQEDKPVFLSIGYSTCHWCHVMEKESYEDIEVARMLNDAFVCIKVDREERPDLDEAYMKVCQQLTGSGGWPLHIIMTPDKKPFFAATYIPRENRFGQIGLKQLIVKVKELWTHNRNEVLESASGISQLLDQTQADAEEVHALEELRVSTMDEAYLQLSQSFDSENGGFGNAPKFPSPHNLMFLLRYWKRTSDKRALEIVEKTLKAMRMGGVYDQLGFGFHRYSTDAKWLVPHFEKMLYDQALLTMAYTEAFQATRDEEFKHTAVETVTYVVRQLTDPSGGFYSAEDADSEGEEGKFYLWTEEQLRYLLNREEADFAINVFNVEKDGNFQDPIAMTKTGNNILHVQKSAGQIALSMGLSLEDFQRTLDVVRTKLFDFREKRVHPSLDDKILVDWNGLMIAALSKAARALQRSDYSVAAMKAADFIVEKVRRPDGRLYHRYREGEPKVDGFLSDYAFFVWGLLELYEAVFETKYLRCAVDLTDIMLQHFRDAQQGGFYFAADDAEFTMPRDKDIYDGASPSGNSVACLNLIRIAHMTGETMYEQKASELMRFFSSVVSRAPSAYAQLMTALDFALGPSCEVVLVGDPANADTKQMIEALNDSFIPRNVVMFHHSVDEIRATGYLNASDDYLMAQDGKAAAYVCCNRVCNPPTSNSREMMELIQKQTGQ